MGRVRRTPESKQDLLQILTYIGADSPAVAKAFVRTLETKIQFLSDNPYAGVSRLTAFPDIRCFPYKTYAIWYRPLADGGIELVRVINSARDRDLIFSPEED